MRKYVILSALLTATIVAPASANLLVNGGFETGDLTGWTHYQDGWGGGVSSAVGGDGDATLWNPTDRTPEGNYSARVTDGNSGSGGIYQVVDTSALIGQTINLQGLVHTGRNTSSNWQDGWHEFGVMPGTNTNPNAGTAIVLYKRDSGAADEWVAVDLPFSVTTPTVTVFAKVGAVNSVPVATWIDAAVLTPEPATLALLGIPMLLFRRRRQA
ncbi:MAG: hypothetical protein AMXMBFR13_00560 [Phycisphaerae bacterium]